MECVELLGLRASVHLYSDCCRTQGMETGSCGVAILQFVVLVGHGEIVAMTCTGILEGRVS